MRLRGLAVFLLAVRLLPAGSELQSSDVIAAPGATVVIPVALAADGSSISGLQFDIDWDDSVNTAVLLGDAARNASKNLYQAVGPHTTRCLIAGLNQQIIGDGELLRLFVSIHMESTIGVHTLRFSNLVATDADGQLIAVTARSVNVDVEAEAVRSDNPATILNAASLLTGAVSPGEIITLLGSGTSSPDTLSVLFNGIRAPVLYAGANQINAVVPFAVTPGTSAAVEIRSQGSNAGSFVVPVASLQPGIFTQDSSGTGPASLLNSDYTINSFANPASRGSIVMVYATGLGPTDPPSGDGESPSDIRWSKVPVSATIDDQEAEVTYAGSAPGLISGITQVNVRIPWTVGAGPTVRLVLRAGSSETQKGVTLSIQ